MVIIFMHPFVINHYSKQGFSLYTIMVNTKQTAPPHYSLSERIGGLSHLKKYYAYIDC